MGEAKSNKNLSVALLVILLVLFMGYYYDLEDKKQLTKVPYDPAYLVHTAFDLGYKDDTSIVFFQEVS